MTRVVLIIGELEIGGTQRQMLELARRLDRDRFTAEICGLSRSLAFAGEVERAGVALHVVEKRSRYDVGIIPRLRRHLRGAGVVITFGSTADLWGRVAARAAGVPVVMSSVRTSREDLRLVNWTNRCLRALGDAYIANSQAVAKYLLDLGVPNERIAVIPNGIDLERFRATPERATVRHELGLPGGSFVVGMVSRLSPEKDPVGFVRVAARVAPALPQVHFVLIGDGPLRGAVEAEVAASNLQASFHCLGARSDVPHILPAFDLAMLTSRREGLSNTLLEYMAASLPIVATNVGGNPEVLREGETGMLYAGDDVAAGAAVVLQLARDDDRRKKMGSAARRAVEERFSMTAMVNSTAALLEHWLASKPARAESRAAGATASLDADQGRRP